MIKVKRASALILSLILVLLTVSFSGCSGKNKDYPVTVGNITFDKRPENIVVLSDNLADIITCMGYVDIVGKSDSVTQEDLKVVPSVGSEASPDMAAITEQNADVVFYDKELDESALTALEESGIPAVKMVAAETKEELSTVYRSIGTILGGAETGKAKGEEAYNNLIASMDSIKSKYSGLSVINTVCYLYAENGELKIAGKNTFADILLGYTAAVNVAVDSDTDAVDTATLKISNPTYIFYSDSSVIDILKSDPTLKNLTALKENKIMQISYDDMSRHGLTALDNLENMVNFMYDGVIPAAKTTSTAETSDGAAVSATAAAATTAGSLADTYKITIPGEGFQVEDNNDNVKAMQQRLFDLGYVSDRENITGYYGQTTKKAVTAFQKNNNLEETGTADKATLDAMFTDSAVKATKAVDEEE